MLRFWLLQALFSFVLTFVVSKVLLSFGKKSEIAVKPELSFTHALKKGTPTIGGLAFSIGSLVATLAFSDIRNPYILLPMVTMVLFLLVGYRDDHMKRRTNNGDGLSSKAKMRLQLFCAIIVLLLAAYFGILDTKISLFGVSYNLGIIYFVFATFYLLYFVNAVNITDGLDALASGASLPVLLLLLLLSGRTTISHSSAMIGAMLAFLYFNRSPARYFMGDAGSHALGAYIGISAILLKAEVIVIVASGLFLLELSSSLIQIISIRRFGRKVFTIAPLHHAYELKGIKEQKIVAACIIASWLFASLALLVSR